MSTSGQETVVPVAMKLVSPELEFGHLLVGDLQTCRIGVGVELAFHRQAGGSRRESDRPQGTSEFKRAALFKWP